MKKNKFYLLIVTALLLSACHDPEYVLPTAERQGITRLVAKFTTGEHADKIAVEYDITDVNMDKFVIPVPYYFPESSSDETTSYMSAMRIEANIANNCKIEPTLAVLDLTKENYFTFTEASGEKRQICITGERTKSSLCQLLSFSLIEPSITGIIDHDEGTVSLISAEDLSRCLAEVSLSYHATISPDPTVEVLDYNEEVEFTVTAHNGVDKKVYKAMKDVPDKIDYGFRAASAEAIFAIDTDNLSLPWLSTTSPTLAATNSHLVICMGDGTTPIYLNRITGQRLGEITLGGASAQGVTSDAAGHILIYNQATSGQTFNLWKTSSATQAPELFASFTNSFSYPLGSKVKVYGDVDGDALIILTCDGISGVTSSSRIVQIVVTDGVPGIPVAVNFNGVSWGARENSTSVVPATTDPADGYFLSYYSANLLHHINGSSLTSDASLTGGDWMDNQNCLDTKLFNNARYLALFTPNFFPQWAGVPQLYLFDITGMSLFSGSIHTTSALAFSNTACPSFNSGDGIAAMGDVLLVPSLDGFKLHLYYYCNNNKVLGAYEFDCIDK